MSVDWGTWAQFLLVRSEWAIFTYFLLVNGLYLALLISSALEMRRHLWEIRGASRWRVLSSRVAPTITILAPAHNEAATLPQSLKGLLSLHYSNLEIVLINDGSTDQTMGVLRDHFDLVEVYPVYRPVVPTEPVLNLYRSRPHPNLMVINKQKGGKADALNAGLNMAGGDLIGSIDADTIIEPDALQRMVRPFIMKDGMLAAGGTVRVVNGSYVFGGRVVVTRASRQLLAGCQTVEYLRAFLFGRLGWNRLGGNAIISGAFGLFRRDAMLRVGGYMRDTVGEDMELVVRMRRLGRETNGPQEVTFIPDPVAWTEVPQTLGHLARQRDRWHRGLADVLWRHRGLLFNPRYGALGLFVLPCFLFVELLAPVVELLGFTGCVLGLFLGLLNVSFAVLFFLAAYGFGIILSVLTLLLEELSFHRYERFRDRALLLLWAFVENLGYRQLTALWRLRGLIAFVRGRKDWGRMDRRGFDRAKRAAPSGVEGERFEPS